MRLTPGLPCGLRRAPLPGEDPAIMGEIVNLRRARKHRARDEKDRQAAAARARHGRTKAQRTADAAAERAAARHLDGHRREDDTEG